MKRPFLRGIARAKQQTTKAAQGMKAKQRIRYIDTPTELVAVVQKRGWAGKWKDTPVREIVNKKQALRALRVQEANTTGNTAGVDFDDTAGFGDRFKKFAK